MHIIYRICDSIGKDRPEWFSKEACLLSCVKTFPTAAFYVLADNVSNETLRMIGNKLHGRAVTQIPVYKRSNSRSFALALEYACDLVCNDGNVIYFVEDDYLHRRGAQEAIVDGILLGYDYVTCYDHPDKYDASGPNPFVEHGGEVSRVQCGQRCHWKNTNSTTMTFATTQDRLRRDLPAIQRYLGGDVPQDFRMWRELIEDHGVRLGSSVPGYATHCEQRWLSRLWDWREEARRV